jgi:hypothetical protein
MRNILFKDQACMNRLLSLTSWILIFNLSFLNLSAYSGYTSDQLRESKRNLKVEYLAALSSIEDHSFDAERPGSEENLSEENRAEFQRFTSSLETDQKWNLDHWSLERVNASREVLRLIMDGQSQRMDENPQATCPEFENYSQSKEEAENACNRFKNFFPCVGVGAVLTGGLLAGSAFLSFLNPLIACASHTECPEGKELIRVEHQSVCRTLNGTLTYDYFSKPADEETCRLVSILVPTISLSAACIPICCSAISSIPAGLMALKAKFSKRRALAALVELTDMKKLPEIIANAEQNLQKRTPPQELIEMTQFETNEQGLQEQSGSEADTTRIKETAISTDQHDSTVNTSGF